MILDACFEIPELEDSILTLKALGGGGFHPRDVFGYFVTFPNINVE